MRQRRFSALSAAAVISIILITGCSGGPEGITASSSVPGSGDIYLYGETHGVKKILEEELELWQGYYVDRGMRHLFVELPYYTAEFLNLWMKEPDDALLNGIYDDWEGTLAYNSDTLAFYQWIKVNCPETVFHGTDVGHQYDTTGERYLAYLRERDLAESDSYYRAEEVMEQGRIYYGNKDRAYRENRMAENFIWEFDRLDSEDIMGIYGSAHTGVESLDQTETVPSMANRLNRRYGGQLTAESLTYLMKNTVPLREDAMSVAGREYRASYFGRQDLNGFKDYTCRDFWRLENSYDDFSEIPNKGDVLPYDNYPMAIELGQVFVVEYEKTDGSVMRLFYRSNGRVWHGEPSTEQFYP